ncbi:MAG: hypothetical protein P8181_07515, partial [bacterium]
MRFLLTQILVITMLVLAVSAVAVEEIYFGDIGQDKIRRCNLNGSSIEELVTTGLEAVGSIAIDRTAGKMYFSDSGGTSARIRSANLEGTNVVDVISAGLGSCYGLALGPEVADCSDATLGGTWLARIVGAAPYDYTVYMTFDGQGTIDDIGSFGVPDSAGEYSVDADCGITGYIWADDYVPFAGQL